jgi:hypothetical protein
VVSPEIEDRDEVEVGNWAKHKKTYSPLFKRITKKKKIGHELIYFLHVNRFYRNTERREDKRRSFPPSLSLLIHLDNLFLKPSDNRFATDTVKILGRQVFPCLAPNNPQVLIS